MFSVYCIVKTVRTKKRLKLTIWRIKTSKESVIVGFGCAVVAVFCAPAIAGAAGLLGVASTGTAVISTISGAGGTYLVKYCQSLEKGKVEEARQNLADFAKSNPQEFKSTFNKYKGKECSRAGPLGEARVKSLSLPVKFAMEIVTTYGK